MNGSRRSKDVSRMEQISRTFCVILFALLWASSSAAQVNITTQRYDNSQTGANLNGAVLTTSNVNSSSFGKLYSYTVDGSVQAQPLYFRNLTVPGLDSRHVLFVVTMNDVVYAFDASCNSANGGILWETDVRETAAGVTPIPITDIVGNKGLNISGNVGIESTPVIDVTTNTMYLGRQKELHSYICLARLIQ
jgi:hypothetical protein